MDYPFLSLYSFPEASQLSGIPPRTVRSWVSQVDQEPRVSFLRLIELVVVAKLRKLERASYQEVFHAHQQIKQDEPLARYPFADWEFGRNMGKDVIGIIRARRKGGPLVVPKPSQRMLEAIVEQFEYQGDFVCRWWPLGRKVRIIVDPRIHTGMPTIAGRGVAVEIISKRFRGACETIDDIAQDFDLTWEQVEDAIRFSDRLGQLCWNRTVPEKGRANAPAQR